MTAQRLSSRAIIGEFYKTLEQDLGDSWVSAVSMYFTSDQASEEYAWLGQATQMREWLGGRNAKGFTDNSITIVNKHFEATMEVLVHELRRDKSGQVLVRVREMARRTNSHWAKLLSTLVENGESSVCYDGQYYFDTDHSEGDSGAQSNDLSIDISALPVSQHGSPTAPSAEEVQQVILQTAQQILSFKDDQGEPMNEHARSFLIKVPISLWQQSITAVGVPNLSSGQTNVLGTMDGFTFRVAQNARLSWTDKLAMFRADSDVAAFIRQEEVPVELAAIAEGSELEFHHGKHNYGVDTWRNVGYGYWQNACLATMI